MASGGRLWRGRLALGLAAGSAAASGRPGQTPGREFVISVPGIPGPYCAYGIEKRLRELPGIGRVELDWNEERIKAMVTAGHTVTSVQIRDAVERSEYPYRYRIEP